MKFTADRAALTAAFKSAVPAAQRKSGNLPVLTGARLDVHEHTVLVTCSNLDLTITAACEAAGVVPGAFVVPAHLAASLLAGFPAGQVTVETNKGTAALSAGSASARLNMLPVAEWPTTKPTDDGSGVELTTDDLALIGRVVHAASPDLARPALTGVMFGGGLVKATDSYRLAQAAIPADVPEALVPATVLTSVLGAVDGSVRFTSDKRQATFATPEVSWTTRLIDADYPATDRLLRADSPHRITVDADRLAEAVERVALLGAETGLFGGRVVTVTPAGGSIVVSAYRPDVGDISDQVTATFTDDCPAICLNSRFIAEMLAAAGPGDLELEIADAQRPVQATSGPVRQVLMPTRGAGS
jgi:DNA polymerase-3 subunit beta